MIEVEKKLRLTDEQCESLIKGAQFVGEKTFTDTYYDTADYKLTTKDIWLRKRGDQFELKVALIPSFRRAADQYDEITDEKLIREKLGLPTIGGLAEDLHTNGYDEFITFATTRRKYKIGPFTIDMDLVKYDNGSTYTLAEIECMVSEQSEVPKAIEQIHALAQSHGCSLEPIRGKGIEYLYHYRPEHFQALVNAGVISAS